VGDNSHVSSGQQLLQWQSSEHRWVVTTVKQPGLALPSLQTFSADVLCVTLQILIAVILVNHLAWGNKFLMRSAITVKKYHQHALDVRPALPHFLVMWRGWVLSLRGLLFGLLNIIANPGLGM
jgi:hypothetical protein